MADNTCTLVVETRHGSAAPSVKVSTEVSGGMSCIGGRTFHTDRNGAAQLKWSSGCYLRRVYLNGTGYDVDYRDGETYYLTMR